MSAEVLIELDTTASARAADRTPPAHRYRPLGLAVALLLVLALAGAVPSVTPMWQRAGLVDVVGREPVIRVVGDRLYVTAIDGAQRVTAAWSASPLRQLWSARTADEDAPARLDVTHDAVVVQVGRHTDVLDARTGRLRWTSPVQVQVLPGDRTGLSQDPRYRPGSEYDESSGDPGALYYASDGTWYTRPPEQTVLNGTDLATGRERWSVSVPGSAFAAEATARPASVVVVASDRLQLLDADTGTVRVQRLLPHGPQTTAYSEVVGDLLMVSDSYVDATTMTAYALDTLAPLWTRPVVEAAGNSRTCTGLLCERLPTRLAVLDRRTGAISWETDGQVDLIARGRSTLVVQGHFANPTPVRTVNPATGAEQADLTRWQSYADGPADQPLVLARPDSETGTVFGVLRAGQRTVTEIGRSDVPVTGCRSGATLVACIAAEGIEVFRYRV